MHGIASLFMASGIVDQPIMPCSLFAVGGIVCELTSLLICFVVLLAACFGDQTLSNPALSFVLSCRAGRPGAAMALLFLHFVFADGCLLTPAIVYFDDASGILVGRCSGWLGCFPTLR